MRGGVSPRFRQMEKNLYPARPQQAAGRSDPRQTFQHDFGSFGLGASGVHIYRIQIPYITVGLSPPIHHHDLYYEVFVLLADLIFRDPAERSHDQLGLWNFMYQIQDTLDSLLARDLFIFHQERTTE